MVIITPAIVYSFFILKECDKLAYTLASNDEISLIMPDWHRDEYDLYEIVLNINNEVVGNLKFHYEVNDITGNIEYEIYEEYRGKSYAKKALKLFAKNVSELSNYDIFISILPNNIASIKTAVGAGALFHQMVEIPKKYIMSEEGKYKYANMYIIKNDRGVYNEKNKFK